MAYVKKLWKDTIAEFPNRRVLKNTADNTTQTVTVTRSVGTVSQEGDAWNASNMNGMEQRIADAFDRCLEIVSFDASTGTLTTRSNV